MRLIIDEPNLGSDWLAGSVNDVVIHNILYIIHLFKTQLEKYPNPSLKKIISFVNNKKKNLIYKSSLTKLVCIINFISKQAIFSLKDTRK